MKRIGKSLMMVVMGIVLTITSKAQTKIDDQRMERDIEVAENVLSTLIRQQFSKRNFFPFDVEGSYSQGFGVTFRLPMDYGSGPMVFAMPGPDMVNVSPEGFTYSYGANDSEDKKEDKECEDCHSTKSKAKGGVVYRKGNSDSVSRVINERIIAASKEFIADYGDLIGQLTPDERIKITNRHEGQRFWYGGNAKRRLIALECTKGDVSQYKQSKLTRDQLMAKINVVDSESSDEMSPDLELLSSMFNRLYRPDLSKSYYAQDNVYYERLKNYGVVYYMQVYSSNQTDLKKYDMPTVNLENINKETRDKKVVELYPVFEKDIKESMLDYGRTLKSLSDNEVLVFNIKLTQCDGCGIPSSIEVSVKNTVLRDFSSGKLTKEAALALVNVKKGPNQ